MRSSHLRLQPDHRSHPDVLTLRSIGSGGRVHGTAPAELRTLDPCGGSFAADPQRSVVDVEGLGNTPCKDPRPSPRDHHCRPQAGRDPASHVACQSHPASSRSAQKRNVAVAVRGVEVLVL